MSDPDNLFGEGKIGSQGPYAVLPNSALDDASLIGPDYEPEGGVDYQQDEVDEPERDIEALTQTFEAVEKGDVVVVEAGPAGDLVKSTWLCLSHERDANGFDHRINFVMWHLRNEDWNRLYITGSGHDDLDDWELASAPYNRETGTAHMADFAANGWLTHVEVVDP